MINEDRITEIAEQAEEQFWKVVSDEANLGSGDLDPAVAMSFTNSCRNAVRSYVQANQQDPAEALLKKLPRECGTWERDIEHNGIVTWCSEECGIVIHATPFWEGSDGIPFSLDNGSGTSIDMDDADGSYQGYMFSLKQAIDIAEKISW